MFKLLVLFHNLFTIIDLKFNLFYYKVFVVKRTQTQSMGMGFCCSRRQVLSPLVGQVTFNLKKPIHMRRISKLMVVALIATASIWQVGCDKGVNPIAQESEDALKDGDMLYPATAQYVIYREYISLNPQIKTVDALQKGFPEYLEKRLNELYPQKRISKGRVRKEMNRLKQLMNGQETAHRAMKELYIPTLEQERDTLQLTTAEFEYLQELEGVAEANILAKRSGYGSAKTNVGWLMGAVIGAGVGAALGGYIGFRIDISRERAYDAETLHYGSIGSGNKSDAFRHIYVNVMLTRYIGRFACKIIMDANESRDADNPPRDKVMDLHNNDIGRRHKYGDFRGGLGDLYDWRKWGRNVRDYINIPSNAEYIFEWNSVLPSTEALAWEREALVSDLKYIHYKN